MKLKIIKNNDYYSFVAEDSFSKEIFSSAKEYFLIPSVKSCYKYAWEACRDGRRIVKNNLYHLDALQIAKGAREDLTAPVIVNVSAEEMLINHYLEIMKVLKIKIGSAKGDKEETDRVYKETQMVISELETIEKNITDKKDKKKIHNILVQFKNMSNKFFRIRKKQVVAEIVDPDIIDSETKEELLNDYAQKACKAIQDFHRGAFYNIDENSGDIIIYEKKEASSDPILKMTMNDKLHISSIVPVGSLSKIYPVHTPEFYQKYWRPIVESIGHFYIDDASLLLAIGKVEFPDISVVPQSYVLSGWNTDKNQVENISLSFRGKNSPIWVFEINKSQPIEATAGSDNLNVSKYTEQDYLNAIVKCMDSNLDSIYGRTGEVIQIIPHEDIIEVDVDFGRGIGIVRLTEKQIEIVV